MSLDETSYDNIRKEVHKELSGLTVKELAIYFSKGHLDRNNSPEISTHEVENKRIIVRDYLSTQSEEFRTKFKRHLDNSLSSQI